MLKTFQIRVDFWSILQYRHGLLTVLKNKWYNNWVNLERMGIWVNDIFMFVGGPAIVNESKILDFFILTIAVRYIL